MRHARVWLWFLQRLGFGRSGIFKLQYCIISCTNYCLTALHSLRATTKWQSISAALRSRAVR
jgi:hypothetical protein